MSKDLVNQPTSMPTRKMTVFAVTSIATAAVLQWTGQIAEASEWFRWLADPTVKGGLPVVVGFGIAYLFRDKNN